jgi:hypothetical protein
MEGKMNADATDATHPAGDDRGEPTARQEAGATRRDFLANLRAAAAVAAASGALSLGSSTAAKANPSSRPSGQLRAQESFSVRLQAATSESLVPIPQQTPNRDEQLYSNFIGNYSKGLPHSPIGEVNTSAYRTYLNAVNSGTWNAFEHIPLGGNTPLVNPLSGIAFDLEGTDSHQLAIPAALPVASQARADEMVELYWQALCRDVNFTDYPTNPLTQAAAAELSSLSGFTGPRIDGQVTAQTLFRGFTADDVIGPYVSQLAMRPFNYGPYPMTGQITVYLPGIDYMTTQAGWLAVQNGHGPFGSDQIDPQTRFIRNGRDYGVYVHTDPNAGLLISFYNAGIMLFEMGAPLNPGNPYLRYTKQAPFATFGVPHFLGLLGEAKQRACKDVWYAKWFVHRTLRPEAYGGLVHMTMTGQANYPLNRDVLNSRALANTFSKYGTYLLPQAFPEGSPQHPSYAQGHGSMAGACATILKAAFNGSTPFASLTGGSIVTASEDGLSLVPYTAADAAQMTVNGEINKLASNIGVARDHAGIHWRSDYQYGLLLGEAAALSVLSDQSNDYLGENFNGFTITKFDGTTVTV